MGVETGFLKAAVSRGFHLQELPLYLLNMLSLIMCHLDRRLQATGIVTKNKSCKKTYPHTLPNETRHRSVLTGQRRSMPKNFEPVRPQVMLHWNKRIFFFSCILKSFRIHHILRYWRSQAFTLKTFGVPTLHASLNQRSFSREQRQGRRQRERHEEAQGAPLKRLDIYLFQLVS